MNKQIKFIINKIHSMRGKRGKKVAIETKTGKWFMADSTIEAINKGEEFFPDGIFYIIKVGYKAGSMLKKSRYQL